MQDVLLISQDANLVTEIQKICAVTQASLSCLATASEGEINNSHTVLIDAELDVVIDHSNVVLVTVSEPGTSIWQKAFATSAKYVAFLPDARPWLLENLTPKLQASGYAVGLIGATGGLGTSLLATLIATNFSSKNKKVVLAEFSNFTGGLDVLCGVEEVKGTRWSHISNQVLAQDLFRSLPTVEEVRLLSNDSNLLPNKELLLKTVKNLKAITDLVVFDLPKIEQPDFGELLQLCDELVLVVGSTIRSINAANQILKIHPELAAAKLVVRQLAGTNLAGLNIARTLGMQLSGEIPTDVKIVEHLEHGVNPAKISANSYRKAVLEICAQLEVVDVRSAA